MREEFKELINEIHRYREGKDLDAEFMKSGLRGLAQDDEKRARVKNLLIKLKIYSSELLNLFASANLNAFLLKLLKAPT